MKILVVCAGGISTNILAESMKNHAESGDIIKALPSYMLQSVIDDYEVVLVAPQIEYSYETIQDLCEKHDVRCLLVSYADYGHMDGETVIGLARQLLEEHPVNRNRRGKSNMKQLKITLACAGGVSTSILCSKLISEGKAHGYEVECKAYSTSALTKEIVAGSAVILLGPQVMYMEDDVVKHFPEIPVRVMAMTDYGTMNAKKIFQGLSDEFHW